MGYTHHPPPLVVRALRARADGLSRSAVSDELSISPSTLATWESGRVPRQAQALLAGHPACETCGWHHPTGKLGATYAYLLGVYLGDGYIIQHARTTALKVALDVSYPGIVNEAARAIGSVRGHEPHIVRDRDRAMVLITSYWRGWPCLFPQAGPGRKHTREIVLSGWQASIVRDHPGPLLRGLIHTDGWRGENHVRARGRSYTYPRYQFSNRSSEIRQIFCNACDALGVEWRPWGRWNISVARRAAVETLDLHVGLKT